MKLASITRYPVKGFTPEVIAGCRLEPGSGIPFDRALAFISGNLPEVPVPGGWVQARTFFQLTVYPELARFRATFDDAAGTLTVTAPDGESATAQTSGGDLDAVNALVEARLQGGDAQRKGLSVQATGKGHWDFTDSCLSLINRASVDDIGRAAGVALNPHRFRGNLLLDDLPPWQEFSLVGRRLRVGDALLEVLRPAERCAATIPDPVSGDTNINVPQLLRRLTGHGFCGIYARVIEGGIIAAGDCLSDAGPCGTTPAANTPLRSPPVQKWPRFAVLAEHQDDCVLLSPDDDYWPFETGVGHVWLHRSGDAGPDPLKLTLVAPAEPGNMRVQMCQALFNLAPGDRVLISGPFRSG